MSEVFDGKSYIGSVKVGTKGQIVIPKEARDIFGIKPGDTLLLLADKSRGIAMQKPDILGQIADAIFAGNGKEIYPENTDEMNETFANAIKTAMKEE